MIQNLPLFLKSRFYPYLYFDWKPHFNKHFIIVIISVIIGAFSHIFWDNFTHSDGYFVNKFAFFHQKINLLNWSIPVFKIFQHSSTILGGLIIFISILKLPKLQTVSNITPKYWLLIVFITLCMVAIQGYQMSDLSLFGNLIAAGIFGILLSMIVVPFCIKETK